MGGCVSGCGIVWKGVCVCVCTREGHRDICGAWYPQGVKEMCALRK